jgi:hypothetical protein
MLPPVSWKPKNAASVGGRASQKAAGASSAQGWPDMRRQREAYGAAPTTVEALMYELRTDGIKALATPNCQRRLCDLSTAQVREVIERLMKLRPRYPAITDQLLFQLAELLP